MIYVYHHVHKDARLTDTDTDTGTDHASRTNGFPSLERKAGHPFVRDLWSVHKDKDHASGINGCL